MGSETMIAMQMCTMRRAAGQSTDNTKTTSKQATSNTQTGQLMDDEGEGVSECNIQREQVQNCQQKVLYNRTICK